MRIMPILLALFILTPLIEIYLFIEIGSVIGALQTILLIVITAVIGVALLRHQGLSTMQKVQTQMQHGELPAVGMIEGMMLFFAGALLLTPGFFTDAIGFLFLIPPLRKALALWFLERSGTIVKIHPHQRDSQRSDKYIDGDYDRHDD
ncbi:MAG: FxsA family protein [Thioalkalispiraceae bacterium]|jgi:UPF0716 protein FxsA